MRNAMVPRLGLGLLAVVLAAGCLSEGESPGARTPDPSYRPREGDEAVLFGLEAGTPIDPLPILGDMTSYDQFERARKANSGFNLKDLEERGWLKWTPPGTRVLVKTIHDRTHAGARLAAQVRVLDGGHKGGGGWVPAEYITRFVANQSSQ